MTSSTPHDPHAHHGPDAHHAPPAPGTSSPHRERTRPSPVRRMVERGRDEQHRVASSLELFFDLCFVVAVAQGGVELVHAIAEGHAGSGVINYARIFFAIWWAWMNFTWFASAYDNDDVIYRVVTLVQIAGVLVLAAGVSRAFEDDDFTVVWLGYLIMRVAMAAHWLRAARSSGGAERKVALRYAGGVLVCQVGWLALMLTPDWAVQSWIFLAMAVLEMCVPVFAERDRQTSWHAHHISERYGLFTIIVIGESIAAATVAVKSGIEEHDALGELLPIAAGGLLIVFAAWWIYFAVPIHDRLHDNRQAFVWGYGHYLIFASAAAIGAGIEVAVEQAVGEAHLSRTAASAAVTVPCAVFLVMVWALHARFFKTGLAQQLTLPVSALAVLACTFAGHWAVLAAGIVTTLTVATGMALSARGGREEEAAAAAF